MLPGSAMADSSDPGCDDGYSQVGTTGIYTNVGGPGMLDGSSNTSAGACATNLPTSGLGFTGGGVEAGTGAGGVIWGAGGPGTSLNPNGHPTCGWGNTDPQCAMNPLVSGIPGVYVVAQGQSGNTIGTGQLEGYAGISTMEQTGTDGQSTNSGGEIAIDGVGVYNIPSPLVCGNTSGNNWDSNNRQGCEIP
jgi:hypothetical protein